MRGGVTKETQWTRVTRFMNKYHPHIVGTTVCVLPIFKRSLVPLPATDVLSYHKYRSSYVATPSTSHAIFPFWVALTLVKPANFIMGIDKSSLVINVIGFGLVKGFRDLWTMMHIPYQQDEQQSWNVPFHVITYPQQHWYGESHLQNRAPHL